MPLEALVLCEDAEDVGVMRRVLEKLGIAVDLAGGVQQAQEKLQSRKFDAVLIDCDGIPGSGEVMRALRRSRSNQHSILFAVTRGGTSVKSAYELGANFVLQGPLSMDDLTRSLRAAHGLIMNERRRYYRARLDGQARVVQRGGQLVAAIINVSEGGIALRIPSLPAGDTLRVTFDLPGGNPAIEAQATVAWSDAEKCGLRFVSMTAACKQQLKRWIEARLGDDTGAYLFAGGIRPR